GRGRDFAAGDQGIGRGLVGIDRKNYGAARIRHPSGGALPAEDDVVVAGGVEEDLPAIEGEKPAGVPVERTVGRIDEAEAIDGKTRVRRDGDIIAPSACDLNCVREVDSRVAERGRDI